MWRAFFEGFKNWQAIFFNKFPNQVNGNFVSVCPLKWWPARYSSLISGSFQSLHCAPRQKRPVSERCGWALSSVGFPWVAQRVCPIPVVPSTPAVLADNSAIRPTPWLDGFQHHLGQKSPQNHSHGIRAFKPWIKISVAFVFPTTPTIPHIVYTTQTSCAFSLNWYSLILTFTESAKTVYTCFSHLSRIKIGIVFPSGILSRFHLIPDKSASITYNKKRRYLPCGFLRTFISCLCSLNVNFSQDRDWGSSINLATAIRTVVVILMAWAMVFLTNSQTEIVNISRKVGSFSSYQAWSLAPPGSATTRPCSWAMQLRYLLLINSVSSLPSF